jgi:hypothetical protein
MRSRIGGGEWPAEFPDLIKICCLTPHELRDTPRFYKLPKLDHYLRPSAMPVNPIPLALGARPRALSIRQTFHPSTAGVRQELDRADSSAYLGRAKRKPFTMMDHQVKPPLARISHTTELPCAARAP